MGPPPPPRLDEGRSVLWLGAVTPGGDDGGVTRGVVAEAEHRPRGSGGATAPSLRALQPLIECQM